MLPFALALVFFPKQIARMIVLISKYIRRQDISERQSWIAVKLFSIGAIILVLMTLEMLYTWYIWHHQFHR